MWALAPDYLALHPTCQQSWELEFGTKMDKWFHTSSDGTCSN